MREEKSRTMEQRVVIDKQALTELDPSTIARLRSDFADSLEIRATKPGLADLLDNMSTAKDGERVYDRDTQYSKHIRSGN